MKFFYPRLDTHNKGHSHRQKVVNVKENMVYLDKHYKTSLQPKFQSNSLELLHMEDGFSLKNSLLFANCF